MSDTIIVATPETPETPEVTESAERTLGRLEAETENLSETVEEVEATAEQAEQIAESAQEIAFASIREVSELREQMETGFSRIASQIAELQDDAEDLENEEVTEVEIPIVQEEPIEAAPKSLLQRILFG